MASTIDNITDAMDNKNHGPRELKVWIAEKIDDKTFLVADEYKTASIIVENNMVLSKKFCGVGNFVKIIHPIISDSGNDLILTEKSNMIPMRKKGEAIFLGAPAPFKPCYDPNKAKSSTIEDSDSSLSKMKEITVHDHSTFEAECNKQIGAVSFFCNFLFQYLIFQ